MLSENEVAFLHQVLIFSEFSEEELEMVASRLNTGFIQAGEIVFSQGDVRDHVYIIREGEVKASRVLEDGSETLLGVLDYGDMFGEDAFFFDRQRSETVTAVKDTKLLFLSEADFSWLRETFPKVEPYLAAFSRTRETVSKLNIDWLSDGETIYLAVRRHPIRLIVELTVITFFVFFIVTIFVALLTFLGDAILVTVLTLGAAGIVTLLGFIAGFWTYYEWRNDYFFVTNHRVVWRERMILRSSSRQEVPLGRIQSLDTQTSSILARMIHVGDVIIRTFNSQMRLADVNYPARMKNMVDAFLAQTQKKVTRADHAAIRRTIRHQLGLHQEEPIIEPESPTPKIQKERKGLPIFQTRTVKDDVIAYRKHWWIFIRGSWKSTLAGIISVLIVFATNSYILENFGFQGLFILYLLPFLMFLWWLYDYEDWRNDIYYVTKDRVIDRDKKPFGKESFRSAPINNIQSVGHQIPNIFGLILNVGNVRINVGVEILTFDGVHDPALVHQDISRRMEELAAETERNRIREEHGRMATWLDIYHEETKRVGNSETTDHIPNFD